MASNRAIARAAYAVLTTGTALVGSALPATAWAQNQGSDIIVTARRTEERLSDVPISISVFNQEQISQRNVTDLVQLSIYTPSLQSNNRFGSSHANFSIRGFVQDGATAPSVGIYFANVGAPRGASPVQSGDGAGPGSFFDLQNVQIVKGPQGTLFGRNTTGGAILLEPQKPTADFGGYVEGSIGDYKMRRLQGVVNIPLGDKARLRLGFDRMNRRGYQNNIGLGPRDMSDIDYFAFRGSLVVDLTPTLENYTIVSYMRSNTNGHANTIIDCNPNLILGGVPQGPLACSQIARERATGDYWVVEGTQPGATADTRTWQIINTTTWSVSDDLTLKNIASYAEQKDNLAQDTLGTYWVIPSIAEQQALRTTFAARTPAVNVNVTDPSFVGTPLTFSATNDVPGRNINHQATFTEEFQLQGFAFDRKLQWQAGIYYETATPLDPLVGNGGPALLKCSVLLPANGNCFSPYGTSGRLTSSLISVRYYDWAVYAQSTYDVTDQLRVTAGVRYTRDTSKSLAQSRTYRFDAAGNFTTTLCQVAIAIGPDCVTTARQVTSAPTWVLNVDYKPVDAVMLYAKYSRGYRQGLANPQAFPPNDVFDAEKLDAYEIGGKARWRGFVPGSLNVAGFYNAFDNQQVNVALLGIPNTPTANASSQAICACATSRIYGIEIDGQITLFNSLELSGAYTYLNTRLRNLTKPVPPTGYTIRDTLDIGKRLTQVPAHKWNVSANYILPFSSDEVGKIRIGAIFSYTGDQFSSLTDRGRIPPYRTLDANASWTDFAGKPIDLSFFMTNITNRKYITYLTDSYTSLGYVVGTVGEPRMYGFRARFRY